MKQARMPETADQSLLLAIAPTLSEITLCLDDADMIRPFEHYLDLTAAHMSIMFVSMLEASLGDKLQVLDLASRSHLIWSRIIPSVSQAESTLQYAVAALSSLHEWLNVSRLPAWQNAAFTRFYSRAVCAVNTTTNTSPSSAVPVLLSCLIFAQCEILMGSSPNAATHICSGLNIIGDLQASSESTVQLVHEYIRPIINALLTLQNASNPEVEFEKHVRLDLVGRLLITMPDFLTSMDEAGKILQEVTYRALLLQQLGSPVDRRFLMATRKLANQWSTAFDLLRYSDQGDCGVWKQSHLLLLANLRMAQLILKTMPPEQDEHFRHAEQDFRIIISQVRSFVSGRTTAHHHRNALGSDTTFDSGCSGAVGIIMPLFFTATQAPKLELQLSALDAPAELRVQEGRWNSCIAHAIACKVIEISQRPAASKSASQKRGASGGTHNYENKTMPRAFHRQTRVRLQSVQRVDGTNKLSLTYHIHPHTGSGIYATTETVQVGRCVEQGCNFDWVSSVHLPMTAAPAISFLLVPASRVQGPVAIGLTILYTAIQPHRRLPWLPRRLHESSGSSIRWMYLCTYSQRKGANSLVVAEAVHARY